MITISDLISFYFLLCFRVTDGFIISVSTLQRHLKFTLIYTCLLQQAVAPVVAAADNVSVSNLIAQISSSLFPVAAFVGDIIVEVNLDPGLFLSNTASMQRSKQRCV